jgi:hypothetical protein
MHSSSAVMLSEAPTSKRVGTESKHLLWISRYPVPLLRAVSSSAILTSSGLRDQRRLQVPRWRFAGLAGLKLDLEEFQGKAQFCARH